MGENAGMEVAREVVATVALMRVRGAGAVTVQRLRALAESRGLTFTQLIALSPFNLTQLLPSGLEDCARLLVQARRYTSVANSLLRDVHQAGGTVLLSSTPGYPPHLSVLGDEAPPVLFCRGNLELINRPLAAVVGTRTPTASGTQAAEDCARYFAGLGAGIVSGGADGVDTAAHQAVLKARGTTVVILPSGLLAYKLPPFLRKPFQESRVLLVSQFSPHEPWTVHGAVTRNAVIAALARAVCVIEPHKTGGSIRTGRCALQQGKPVFCLPHTLYPDGGAALHASGAHALLSDTRLRENAIASAWNASLEHTPLQANLF